MLTAAALLRTDFATLPDLIRAYAVSQPTHIALRLGDSTLNYAALDARMDRVAAALQRDGVLPQQAIAICAGTSINYAALYLGALRAGVVVAPLAPSCTAEELASMCADADAQIVFTDTAVSQALLPVAQRMTGKRIQLDAPTEEVSPGSNKHMHIDAWLGDGNATPLPVTIQPDWAFNIIYSSGTTGTPKGIVQPHSMRWTHVQRGADYGYNAQTVTLLSTPLYSNTTLVCFFPTLGYGGEIILMPKFEATQYLELAARYRVTHTMLVPVQYQRLMSHPQFDTFDLSAFQTKLCTSAPFRAELKADVLQRWPGGLWEFYGMTEGGGTCILAGHLHPNKLHTVGQAAKGHDIRLIDDDGCEVTQGALGEVVGHSSGMMRGYHNKPEKTREAEWFAPDGKRFIRTGDVGCFDAEGFLTLMDRKKDMIISGGFNIYPSDLEAIFRQHAAVQDVAIVGVPSEAWGETPVAFVVLRPGTNTTAGVTTEALQAWINERVNKVQRVSGVRVIDELPRSAIGKVLKRSLREHWVGGA